MFIFEILGKPIPQKQTQRGKGHFFNPNSKDIKRIQWQIKPYFLQDPLLGPVQLDLAFFFPIPLKTPKAKKRQMLNQIIHHIKTPDADNCAYLITNALKEIVYKDDSQIIDLYIHKRYGEEPKTVIKVTPIEELAKTRGDPCAS